MRCVCILGVLLFWSMSPGAASPFETDMSVSVLKRFESGPQKKNEVFLAAPKRLDPGPVTVVLYLHGLLGGETFADTLKRQRVAAQVFGAQANAVVIAPHFQEQVLVKRKRKKRAERRVVFKDFSAFATPRGFGAFMKEAHSELARITGEPAERFRDARLVVVAYSMGHAPARALFTNGAGSFESVLMLDAAYRSQRAFARKASAIAKQNSGLFVHAHSLLTEARGEEFRELLEDADVPFRETIISGERHCGIISIRVEGENVNHYDFVTRAWTDDPITSFLRVRCAKQ